MRIEAISVGYDPPHDINVLVEVTIGGEPIKYEMDKASGTMVVDRILYTAMRYPGNYGFIPHTISDDGDPVDVLIANTRPLIPGCIINCRPVGVLFMEDEAGMDEKVIAVPSDRVTQRFDHIREMADFPEIQRRQIGHFFEHYKDLEKDKWVRVAEWGDAAKAREIIVEGVERAKAGG